MSIFASAVRVEFIGGPLDGQRREFMPPVSQELWFVHAGDVSETAHLYYEDQRSLGLALHSGVYRFGAHRATDAPAYHWEGEP